MRNLDLELLKAIQAGSFLDVHKLLEEGAKVNGTASYGNPLYAVILRSKSQEKVARELLAREDIDLDSYVRTVGGSPSKLVALAAAYATVPIMRLLLEKKPSLIDYVEDGPFESKHTLVDIAATAKNADMVDFLLSQGVKPFPKENAPALSMEEWKKKFYNTMAGTLKGGKSRKIHRRTRLHRLSKARVKDHTKRIR